MTPKKKPEETKPPAEEAVLLEDLAPREDVRGGAGRLRFGQDVRPASPTRPPNKKS
jgi:hypothetical protein